MVLYDPLWSSELPYGRVWYLMVLNGHVWCRIVQYCPIWSVQYGPIWPRTVLNGPIVS